MGISSGPSLTERSIRLMTFVDGENLCIQGQRLASKKGVTLTEGDCYQKDTFLCFREGGSNAGNPRLGWNASTIFNMLPILGYYPEEIRAYYYTSYVGSTQDGSKVENSLRALGYAPRVFHKAKQQERAKAVDISLATDMLAHAFRDNFEIAVLIAGDGDYVPLVEEVKRCGKRVLLQFFEEGLSPKLKLAVDQFSDVTQVFSEFWAPHKQP
jgi:hypothetical protein